MPLKQQGTTDRLVDAIVVGAGFGGLYALYRLRDMGLSVLCVERGSDVGGTWFWNRYPGARVDTYSLNYSYSFAEDLQQEWDWSERYAPQAELYAYLRHVTDRFDLRRDILLETEVTSAVWDEESAWWAALTDTGATIRARYLISAAGVLSATNVPDFPGLQSFQGTYVHTSRWPDRLDVSGKRVGVIGTGSSGVQVVPPLARETAHLYVFQRTANFCIPQLNGQVPATVEQEWKASYGDRREEARYAGGGSYPALAPEFSGRNLSPAERTRLLESAWAEGSAPHMMTVFNDVLTNDESNGYVADFIRNKIRDTVKDPEVAELLCPTDHYFATKRPVMENGYYETFNRPNVTLVDVKADPIETITPTGVRTASGVERELDVIVLATGFDAITGPLLRLGVVGRDGQKLEQKWADGPSTYLGMITSGFPNFFFLTGPGSPSVLGNVITSLELHVDWIADVIDHMRSEGFTEVEATPEGEEEWTAFVQAAADCTLYTKVESWYLGSNIPGKARIFLPFVGGVGNYRRACEEARVKGWPGLLMTKHEAEISSAAVTP